MYVPVFYLYISHINLRSMTCLFVVAFSIVISSPVAIHAACIFNLIVSQTHISNNMTMFCNRYMFVYCAINFAIAFFSSLERRQQS